MKNIVLPSSGLVVIIGFPATGKSTLMNELKKETPAQYFHTDDYMDSYSFEEALYAVMYDIDKSKAKLKIVEGVQCYRLLRKFAQLGKPLPDLVIECVAPLSVRVERIAARGKDVNKTLNLDKVLNKVYGDFKMLVQEPKYKFVQYKS